MWTALWIWIHPPFPPKNNNECSDAPKWSHCQLLSKKKGWFRTSICRINHWITIFLETRHHAKQLEMMCCYCSLQIWRSLNDKISLATLQFLKHIPMNTAKPGLKFNQKFQSSQIPVTSKRSLAPVSFHWRIPCLESLLLQRWSVALPYSFEWENGNSHDFYPFLEISKILLNGSTWTYLNFGRKNHTSGFPISRVTSNTSGKVGSMGSDRSTPISRLVYHGPENGAKSPPVRMAIFSTSEVPRRFFFLSYRKEPGQMTYHIRTDEILSRKLKWQWKSPCLIGDPSSILIMFLVLPLSCLFSGVYCFKKRNREQSDPSNIWEKNGIANFKWCSKIKNSKLELTE